MSNFSSMITVALYAMFIQNLIFSPAFGISESIRMAKRPKHFFMYAGFFGLFCVSVSLICYFIYRIEAINILPLRFTFVFDMAVLVLVYLITGAVCKYVLGADKKFMNSLGMCAFNTLIICLPTINTKAGHTLGESLALSVGATFAFLLSMILINLGMRFIKSSKYIPEIFKGTPALFIYVSLLALAMSCLSEGTLSV